MPSWNFSILCPFSLPSEIQRLLRAYHNIGLVSLDKGDTALAEEYFSRSAKLSSAIDDEPGLMKANQYWAHLYLAHHRPSDARALATKAHQAATA